MFAFSGRVTRNVNGATNKSHQLINLLNADGAYPQYPGPGMILHLPEVIVVLRCWFVREHSDVRPIRQGPLNLFKM